MDKRLQTVRGFNPHGSLHISTHMGHITVDQVAGHSSIDLSSIGGSIELLLDSASFSGEVARVGSLVRSRASVSGQNSPHAGRCGRNLWADRAQRNRATARTEVSDSLSV